MAGTIPEVDPPPAHRLIVSMESGLDGRNNVLEQYRNGHKLLLVSMESGLDGRNNLWTPQPAEPAKTCLNGVRPRWPEQ